MSEETDLEFVIAAALRDLGLDCQVYPDLDTGPEMWYILINVRPELAVRLYDNFLHLAIHKRNHVLEVFNLADPDSLERLATKACTISRSSTLLRKSLEKLVSTPA